MLFLAPHKPHQRPLGRMYTKLNDAIQVLTLLIEGMGISSVESNTGTC